MEVNQALDKEAMRETLPKSIEIFTATRDIDKSRGFKEFASKCKTL